MFTPLFKVIALQVVDNCKIVDISATAWDISTLVSGVFSTEFLDQLLYKPQKNRTIKEIMLIKLTVLTTDGWCCSSIAFLCWEFWFGAYSTHTGNRCSLYASLLLDRFDKSCIVYLMSISCCIKMVSKFIMHAFIIIFFLIFLDFRNTTRLAFQSWILLIEVTSETWSGIPRAFNAHSSFAKFRLLFPYLVIWVLLCD